MIARLRTWLGAPEDATGLAAFRVLFGAVVLVSTVRFLANGWIERFFLAPRYHFPYFGLEALQPLDRAGMYAVFVALALASLCVALGLFYRVAIVVVLVLFTYVELLDVALYLNHYYLVSLLALLLAFMPANAAWSLDAWRKPSLRSASVPRWTFTALRFQVAVVYVFAGLAKATPDWLLHAQPMGIWLASRDDMPIVGPLFREPWLAYAMSWGGFLYDTTIAFFLMAKRTRRAAFVAVIGFHLAVGALFPIGMFPLIMIVSATIFFDARWARRLVRASSRQAVVTKAPSRVGLAVLALYAVVQIAVPLRAHLYGGDVAWHEQGMRFSWRVMVREKNGSVTFRVRADGLRERHVYPCDYLTEDQEREMSTQPDLVLALAHRIARDFEARGLRHVEVRVDALVSLNGRRPARMIDPDVDLARIEDGFSRARWVLPAPSTPPLDPSRRLAVR